MKKLIYLLCTTALVMISCDLHVKSAYPLPDKNIFSHYIYISNQYISNLQLTKSHPLAVFTLESPHSPILFYQESYDKYCASSNLHEGAPIVEIDKSSNDVYLFGSVYKKIPIHKTIEKTLEEIIIKNTFSKKKYIGNHYTVSIKNELYINNIKAHAIIGVGGPYNDLVQTMFMTQREIYGYNCFALIEKDNELVLTPLKTDDVVAYSSGNSFLLK